MESTEREKNSINMIKEIQDLYVEEVKRFIKSYNVSKSELLKSMEDNYRSRLTIVPEEEEGKKRFLLEEEINILGDIALSLDPMHADEGGIRKFVEDNFPKVEVKRGRLIYELKGHKFEIFNDNSGYWLNIYKSGELVTGRTFQLAEDLDKLLNLIRMVSVFALDDDFRKIQKLMNNLEKLITKRSKDNIIKPPGRVRAFTNKVSNGIRMMRNIKEFYNLLDEAVGGLNYEKLKSLDIDKYVDDIIRMRFGGGESRFEGRDPAQFFDEVIKPKIYESMEEKNLIEEELKKAKEKVEKAREKIMSFGLINAEDIEIDQILQKELNPYRAIEILEKMNEIKCISIIKEIKRRIDLNNEGLAIYIAELVKAGVDSNKKYIIDAFKEVGVEIISKIKETHRERNFNIFLFMDLCDILPKEVLKEGYHKKIGPKIVKLNEIERRSKEYQDHYSTMKKDAEETAKKIIADTENKINETLGNQDKSLEEKMSEITELIAKKMADEILKKFPPEEINSSE